MTPFFSTYVQNKLAHLGTLFTIRFVTGVLPTPAFCLHTGLQMRGVSESWNWFLWQTPVPYQCGYPFCFCFCFCFWGRDGSSLLLLFHCLPHCNSHLTCLVIPEFPKRSHRACDSTVSAWLVRREDASVVTWRLTEWDSGCRKSACEAGIHCMSTGGRTGHVWRNIAWDPCNFASRKLQSFLGF